MNKGYKAITHLDLFIVTSIIEMLVVTSISIISLGNKAYNENRG